MSPTTQHRSRGAALNAVIAAVLALLLLSAGIAQADPDTPDPRPIDPALVQPDHQFIPSEPCEGGCDSFRLPGPDERDPIQLNPQPLPPGRR